MMHFLESPWVLALIALMLVLVDMVLVLRPRRRMMALAAMMLSATACERPAPQRAQAPPPPPPDTANIARYNRGTKLLGHDSLKAAMARLDSASESKDSVVGFRSAFNSGWDYLVNGKRTQDILKKGGAKADSLLAMIEKDTAYRKADDFMEGSDDTSSSEGAPEDGGHRKTAGHLSKEDRTQLANDYALDALDSAQARYRAALISNPKDADAKWNYELALYASTAGEGQPRDAKSKGKGKGKRSKGRKSKNSKKSTKKGSKGSSPQKGSPNKTNTPPPKSKQRGGQADLKKPSKGKGDQGPQIERLRLPPQQAEQILNAMGQHEQQAAKSVPVPVTPPPQGKDW